MILCAENAQKPDTKEEMLTAISGRIQRKNPVNQIKIHVGPAQVESQRGEVKNLLTGKRKMTEGGPAGGRLCYGR